MVNINSLDKDKLIVLEAWTMDYLRAFRALPKWKQYLAMLVLGKLAWREMIGLRECIEMLGYNTEGHNAVGEGCEYYKDGKKWIW